MKAARKPRRRAAILGLGLDRDDLDRDDHAETRLTRGKNFVLFGGSAETHASMQETAIKMNEQLDKRGKRLEDVTPHELGEIFKDIHS